mmetsp:Transcript_14368/g.43705  ORF Transcript_14368/g.43705 Transcript_14368/m.43705 type:complete len:254 (+) Transcript_14368:1561-2322(+)
MQLGKWRGQGVAIALRTALKQISWRLDARLAPEQHVHEGQGPLGVHAHLLQALHHVPVRLKVGWRLCHHPALALRSRGKETAAGAPLAEHAPGPHGAVRRAGEAHADLGPRAAAALRRALRHSGPDNVGLALKAVSAQADQRTVEQALAHGPIHPGGRVEGDTHHHARAGGGHARHGRAGVDVHVPGVQLPAAVAGDTVSQGRQTVLTQKPEVRGDVLVHTLVRTAHAVAPQRRPPRLAQHLLGRREHGHVPE